MAGEAPDGRPCVASMVVASRRARSHWLVILLHCFCWRRAYPFSDSSWGDFRRGRLRYPALRPHRPDQGSGYKPAGRSLPSDPGPARPSMFLPVGAHSPGHPGPVLIGGKWSCRLRDWQPSAVALRFVGLTRPGWGGVCRARSVPSFTRSVMSLLRVVGLLSSGGGLCRWWKAGTSHPGRARTWGRFAVAGLVFRMA